MDLENSADAEPAEKLAHDVAARWPIPGQVEHGINKTAPSQLQEEVKKQDEDAQARWLTPRRRGNGKTGRAVN